MFLWVEVLNRALAWQDRDNAADDLAVEAGWGKPEHEALVRDAALLREAWAARALGSATPGGVEDWLRALRIAPAPAERWRGFVLPPLRAHRPGSHLGRRADEVLSTALLELVVLRDVVEAVSRCHGLRRSSTELPTSLDLAFAARAGLDKYLALGWSQCPQLVHAPRLGRYCSKACSNAAFAARKGRQEPRYFASKQAQYRDRQRRAVAPVRRDSAFAFVD